VNLAAGLRRRLASRPDPLGGLCSAAAGRSADPGRARRNWPEASHRPSEKVMPLRTLAGSILRRLVVAVSAEALGNGIFLVAGLVYFTRHAHFHPPRAHLRRTPGPGADGRSTPRRRLRATWPM
jgi:hypothetical protein